MREIRDIVDRSFNQKVLWNRVENGTTIQVSNKNIVLKKPGDAYGTAYYYYSNDCSGSFFDDTKQNGESNISQDGG